MRADIHDGSEHTLQSEAGYIDARPHQPESRKPLAPHGRTIHVGQNENSPILGLCQLLPPAPDIGLPMLRRLVPGCMARPRVARRLSKSDERESCINVSGL